MAEEHKEDIDLSENEIPEELSAQAQEITDQEETTDKKAFQELNNKYLRLYADFENYRKRVNRDREELVKYGNESLLYELLPAIDNLELALKHASESPDTGIVQGVEITLKELHRILDKFGLSRIEAEGKCFDPSVHHAMMQEEREDLNEKMVTKELRAGYLYRDKVLRPSLVTVSVRPLKKEESTESEKGSEAVEIKINKNIEEE